MSWFRRNVVPGLVFKAAVIGGAYSTGRELAEFFAPHGPWGGLVAILCAMLVWSVTFAVSLEFARLTRSFDYKTFFEQLIGRGWVIIEILMLLLLFLIVSVVEATASEMLHALAGVPNVAGTVLFSCAVAALLVLGTQRIETLISGWSFVLYGFYALFLVLALYSFGSLVASEFRGAAPADLASSSRDGLRYAGYNIAAIAMVLFTARNVTTRSEALLAGVLGGPLAMLPGLLFFIAMMAYYPEVNAQVLPVNFLMERIGLPLLPKIYLSVILVTLLGTAATVLHSFNQRIGRALQANGRSVPRAAVFLVPAAVMLVSVVASTQFGLVPLVAKGYGFIALGFIAFFIVPILTVGVWRIWRMRGIGIVTSVART
jgi:uncharacterized membrane protein YkvI